MDTVVGNDGPSSRQWWVQWQEVVDSVVHSGLPSVGSGGRNEVVKRTHVVHVNLLEKID